MEQFLELIRKRRPPGILIFDCNGRLLYTNKEVLALLPNLLETDSKKRNRPRIPVEIHRLCHLLQHPPISDDPAPFQKVESDCSFMVDGIEQLFSLRAFLIGGHGRRKDVGHIMVLIERVVEKHGCDFEKFRKIYNLSTREMDVVRLLYEGFSNRMIAENLCISEYTVKDHLKKIMGKTRVESRSEIVAALR